MSGGIPAILIDFLNEKSMLWAPYERLDHQRTDSCGRPATRTIWLHGPA